MSQHKSGKHSRRTFGRRSAKKTIRYKFEGHGPSKTITVKDGWALRKDRYTGKTEKKVFDPHHAQASEDYYSPSELRLAQAYRQLEQELGPDASRQTVSSYKPTEIKELSSEPQTKQERYDEYYSKKAAKKHGKKFYEGTGLEAFNK